MGPSFCLEISLRSVRCVAGFLALPEQERDAPESGDADQCVDDSAEGRHLSAAQEGHNIEAENSDAAPVQGADNRQDEGNLIDDHL